MKSIYYGTMKNYVIKELQITENGVKIAKYETPIVKRQIPFYKGFMGNYISLEHGTRLPDEYEAMDYLKDAMNKRENKEAPYPTCTFVNEEDIKFSHEVCDENFKAIKKYYSNLRKEERRETKKRSKRSR